MIRFLLNGNRVDVNDIAPTTSILNYLRYDLGLIGTKEGCAEGDCGACTIVVAELDVHGKLITRAINACIQFVPGLNGKAIYTVEYLRQQSGNLHPVQQAMVDCHGSQCGFCTPGFIMSLWNVYLDHSQAKTSPSDLQLRTALSGNLCRCTGYKPILEAGKKMFDLPSVKFDEATVADALKNLNDDSLFEYEFQGQNFYSPKTLKQLTVLRAKKPQATLIAGCTDVGLWVNKQFRDLGDMVYTGNVAELKNIVIENDELYIGAAASLTDAFDAIAEYFPQIDEQWKRFASVPIRNAGTLGGNVANGSPIGDSMPWLITLNAKVKLASATASRVLPLEDLYTGYMQKSMHEDEIVEAVIVPVSQPGLTFRTYKLSKRYDSDISAVCAAFAIRLDDKTINDVRIAYGGMAAVPMRAVSTESSMNGKVWNEDTVATAMEKISDDFSPLSDMRASADNRRKSATNLLYRFFLETRPDSPLGPDELSVFESA